MIHESGIMFELPTITALLRKGSVVTSDHSGGGYRACL